MAKKATTIYACAECGNQATKWLGRCPECNAWNSYGEERPATVTAAVASIGIADVDDDVAPRVSTDIPALDRVLGGGLVAGAVTLVGGEPGIGKSTLLLQAAQKLAQRGRVLYVSGEESPRQIAIRARRLGIAHDNIRLFPETSI